MSDPSSPPSGPSEFTVRPFVPADAAGVTQLIELVYGDSYYPRDLYEPRQIILRNAAHTLVSVVALDATGRLVGHYALERPHLEAVAEASDAIVCPDCRHHHL